MNVIKWYAAEINLGREHEKKPLLLKERVGLRFGKDVYSSVCESPDIDFELVSTRHFSSASYHSGGIYVFGDIELHNRHELKEMLGEAAGDIYGQEELLIRLFEETGMDFVKRLVGSFSFVLYDTKNDVAYTVRDHMGMKPIFWVRDGQRLIVSSDMFLIKDESSGHDLNETYFSEFVESNGIVDSVNTPYKKIMRVPSASFVRHHMSESTVRKYWDLADVNEPLTFPSLEGYINEFDDLFRKAVQRRLRRDESDAVMLSGGLDSTAIYATGKEVELTSDYRLGSISAVFEELSECDESEYIDGLLKKYNSEGLFKNFDNILMFEGFPHSIPVSDEPNVNSLTYNFTKKLIDLSAARGHTNILSGFAGDHLLGGSAYVASDKVKELKVRDSLKILTSYSIGTNTSAFKNFKTYVVSPKVLDKEFGDKTGRKYKELKSKLEKIKRASKKELYVQIAQAKSHLYTDRVIGGYTGTDFQYPFLDRELVEFIFKIPGELMFDGSKKKLILRESMKGKLTDEILSRENKTQHVAHTYKSLRANWTEVFQVLSIGKVSKELNLVSYEKWLSDLSRWRNGLPVDDRFWSLISVEFWLHKHS